MVNVLTISIFHVVVSEDGGGRKASGAVCVCSRKKDNEDFCGPRVSCKQEPSVDIAACGQ